MIKFEKDAEKPRTPLTKSGTALACAFSAMQGKKEKQKASKSSKGSAKK